ncbi:TIGR03013 family XrtA/PEP-CTERM system glycosyltransferase [Sphingorhabdus sp.]|uniref:TIGR03013 family XrtA/PEP-CTERM system glycosyltransferase n=1 Tax=Sphingorhabdus sp. TaxID=1902408 RepID=UPI00391A9C8B
MIRLFKHYIPYPVLVLAVIDFCLLIAAAETAWLVRAHHIGMHVDHIGNRIGPLLTFAASVHCAAISVGVYGSDALQSSRFAIARLLVAVSLGIIFQSLMAFLLPGSTLWRTNSVYAMMLAFIFLATSRAILGSMVGSQSFKRRLLVLGAGARAQRIKDLEAKPGAGFVIVGFIAMDEDKRVIPEAINRSAIFNLADLAVKLGTSEVVLALEERRNALPVDDLLRIKTTGVHVNDISTFLERETGRIDLESVNPSWLIFSDGFSSGRRLSGIAKRLFDITASSLLLLITAPIIILFALLVKLESDGPAFYRQVRVGLFGQPYNVLKLRSMHSDAEQPGEAVWAQQGDRRVTGVGKFIRKVRIDELPQTWNVLKGEMSFVGPRPERPEFVADLEKQLSYYAERHMVKPGITGWAQINYPYGASIEDSRHKLEYDLYYAKNYTPFLDMLILLQTLRVVLWPEGAR